MIVDDNANLRELMSAALRAHGYDVVEAGDGHEAVQLVKLGCPALILMDIHMPVMGGLEATRLIRDIKEVCQMPIVAFSAYGEEGDNRRKALEAGCTDYVSKTAGITDLPLIVARHLRAA